MSLKWGKPTGTLPDWWLLVVFALIVLVCYLFEYQDACLGI